ncbi:hypothetical protein U1Q18_000670 [Sarracenia purpurea var. burkii]
MVESTAFDDPHTQRLGKGRTQVEDVAHPSRINRVEKDLKALTRTVRPDAINPSTMKATDQITASSSPKGKVDIIDITPIVPAIPYPKKTNDASVCILEEVDIKKKCAPRKGKDKVIESPHDVDSTVVLG